MTIKILSLCIVVFAGLALHLSGAAASPNTEANNAAPAISGEEGSGQTDKPELPAPKAGNTAVLVSTITDSTAGGLNVSQAKRLEDLERENARLRRAVSDLTLDKVILQEAARGYFQSPSHRRRCVQAVCEGLMISERRACRALGQHRSTQRHRPQVREDEDALTAAIVALATRFGRYG